MCSVLNMNGIPWLVFEISMIYGLKLNTMKFNGFAYILQYSPLPSTAVALLGDPGACHTVPIIRIPIRCFQKKFRNSVKIISASSTSLPPRGSEIREFAEIQGNLVFVTVSQRGRGSAEF